MTRFDSQWFRFQWLRIFGAITAITFIVSATTTAQVHPVYTALNSGFESGGYTPDIWPSGYLALGQDGNFYGTTNFNQSNIYMMTPSGVETLLWESGQGAGDQCEWGADGIFYGGLTLGSDGTFYGVCAMWGNDSGGYYISYNGGSSVNVFSPFSTSNTSPNPLILAPDGNLYGTTVNGGAYGTGSVIKLTPSGELTTLYSFKEGTASGYSPEGPLALGRNGDLYGTTPVGGLVDTDGAAGVFFQITT
ncbi:MAG: choice-of-anchor tandem repeat GloVer-containing protein, partial [Terriglobales bacterium]